MSGLAENRSRRGVLLAWRALGPVDARSVLRDSLLSRMLLVPVLVWAALRFGLPPFADWLEVQASFDLRPAFPVLAGYAGLALVPILFAMITGFLLLDERDTGTATAIAVTPLSPRSYVIYRTGLPFVVAASSAVLLIPASGMASAPRLSLVLSVVLGACGAPLYALVLAALASDKVQGLALVKVMSALQLLPVAAFFMDSPWRWIAAVVPSYWPLHAFVSAAQFGGTSEFAFYWLVGAAFHATLIAWLLHRFQRVSRY
jgi:fluoroquinolone transport system permease protein